MTAPPDVGQDRSRPTDLATLAESRTDPDRFVALFDKYHPEIHRYAYSRLGGSAADDVASEVFLIAYRERHRFDATDPAAHVRAWLYGIATNLVRRHRRDEERRYRALGRLPVEPVEPEPGERAVVRLTAAGARNALATALAALKTRDRDVLLLVALAGLSQPEIAVALDIPPGTVYSRLNRARRQVRAALGADPTLPDEA
ncbi:RNA polymerase sigma factor [Plantactinospora sp. GCM10030261]|uniref:RNA polymerase sigma factor n=1 Tax=Plantactinospora sp. GCM10030261 TaxID=3273420 RepID=UPI00361413B3